MKQHPPRCRDTRDITAQAVVEAAAGVVILFAALALFLMITP